MFFSRKGRLRKEGDQRLLQSLDEIKTVWTNQKAMVERSLEPSDQVLYELKLTEAKYLFLLKEAKIRKVTTGRLK
ncbi:YaaL family protein [Fictibacillus fluitans]|uniref:YaaL family protein n=1 Tax=Fictibacillus fluitans TaxID=3058422 RepID=A0ABT8I3V2_9BACL|nr:YaaL family protein [Fictibacillus sp. NE201]MDN4527699.1 YaaL family protein [Fictibacillus sp. NE201]